MALSLLVGEKIENKKPDVSQKEPIQSAPPAPRMPIDSMTVPTREVPENILRDILKMDDRT